MQKKAGRRRGKIRKASRPSPQNLVEKHPHLVDLPAGLRRYTNSPAHSHRAPSPEVGVNPCQRFLRAQFRVELAKQARGNEPGPALSSPTVDVNNLSPPYRRFRVRRRKRGAGKQGD